MYYSKGPAGSNPATSERRGPGQAKTPSAGGAGDGTIRDVSEQDRRSAAREALVERWPEAPEAVRALAEDLGQHAPAILPLLLFDPPMGEAVLASRPERSTRDLRKRFRAATADLEDDEALLPTLRKLRHAEMVRIATREIGGHADIDDTARELAQLAEAALEAALAACRRTLEARYGVPVDPEGAPIGMVVLGMGKLGGGELNLGSDIDICFFHRTDQGTVGEGLDIGVHEFFSRLARRTTRALSEVTEDGFVFRVDLRLRPEGTQGPLTHSLVAAERYYEGFGRTWERGALLRARPVAGDRALGEELLEALQPFIFPKRVDPSVAHAMHGMVLRSRKELRVDAERDVKLGRGGIREAEFFVQGLQLVWGGVHPELRVRGTVDAIRRLEALGFIADGDAAALERAWALLRRVEHRIHLRKGYQTFDLPTGEEAEELAHSLGFDDVGSMMEALEAERAVIHDFFTSLVEEPDDPTELEPIARAVREGREPEPATLLECLDLQDPDAALAHLARMARPKESPFAPIGHRAHPRLAVDLLDDIASAADPDAALAGLSDFFLRGGVAFTRWLADEPRLRRRLVGLFGASPGLGKDLNLRVEVLGELIQGSGPATDDELSEAHAQLPTGEPELFVDALRRLQREQVLRIGLAHIGEDLSARQASERLSALAEHQVDAAFRFVMSEARARFGEVDGALAVVGMGKLGSRELGFASDLDLVFVYDRDGESEGGRTHAEIFTRVAQRTMRLLSQLSAEGPGYEIDARLRPSGSQGLLVVSEKALERYHAEQSEGWERQALVRARAIAGSVPGYCEKVDPLLEHLAYAKGEPRPERLAELRGRMQLELAREKAHHYHPKLGFGGLVDVELATQWLQMHDGDSSVRKRHTLDALAALRARRSGPPDALDALREGYRFFRGVEQALQLLDPTADGLTLGGPRWRAVTRRLGVRARDGADANAVLERDWRRIATAVREAFDAIVAPVDAPAPWAGEGER